MKNFVGRFQIYIDIYIYIYIQTGRHRYTHIQRQTDRETVRDVEKGVLKIFQKGGTPFKKG